MNPLTFQQKVQLLALLKIVLVYAVIALSFSCLPFHDLNYQVNFSYPPAAPITLLSAFLTWDARFYYFIAEQGYQLIQAHGQMVDLASAYYPLYPILVSFFGNLMPTPVAGLLISNLAFIVALSLFGNLLRYEFNEQVALRSVVLLLLFPTSFFFSLMYTESLFFLLLMLLFQGLSRRLLLLTGISAPLLPLTRPVGILIIIPLAYLTISKERKFSVPHHLLLLIAPLVGFLATQLIISSYTGNLWSAFNAQAPFTSKYSIATLLHPLEWFKMNFIAVPWELHGIGTSILDRIFLLLYLPILFGIWRSQSRLYLLFALAFSLVPAVTGVLNSYIRYLLVIFPAYPLLTIWIGAGPRLPKIIAISIALSLQLWLIVRYSLNYWAG